MQPPDLVMCSQHQLNTRTAAHEHTPSACIHSNRAETPNTKSDNQKHGTEPQNVVFDSGNHACFLPEWKTRKLKLNQPGRAPATNFFKNSGHEISMNFLIMRFLMAVSFETFHKTGAMKKS